MPSETKPKAQLISPDVYPQMVSKGQAATMVQTLRSPATIANATRVVEERSEALREAVRAYVTELEAAGTNFTIVSEKAHEIRGFAETAGMLSTGRIADGLCRYFEDVRQAGGLPDAAVVALHVSAIGRTARDPEAANHMSDVVARELAVLAGRKLVESRKAQKNS